MLGIGLKRGFNYLFWIAVIVLLANLGRTRLNKAHAQVIPTPVPYTVTLEQFLVQADGSSRVVNTQTWAIRSDGARASRIVVQGGTVFSQRNVDFASGKHLYIVETSGRKTTFLNSNSASTWLRDPESKCVNSTRQHFIGEEVVSGYRTAKVASDGITQWFALEYGCALVKDVADWGKERNETHLVKLTPGEPAPELFSEPTDYREVALSELFKRAQ